MSIKPTISSKIVSDYRDQTCRYLPGNHLKSKRDAVKFVNDRQIIFFWPIKGITFPSLWGAVAGNRPVPNNHDDPGHITWRWKDELLGSRKWYYAKVLRRKSTIISLDMIENFFSLSNTVYQSSEDVDYLYRTGKLSIEEREIFTLLYDQGPLDTTTLREKLLFRNSLTPSRFNRAMELLQRDFRILPVGLSDNGHWNYSYLFDTVQRIFPEKIIASKNTSKEKASEKILLSFFQSNGIGTLREIKKLFHWEEKIISRAIKCLVNAERIFLTEYTQDGNNVYAAKELIMKNDI